VIGLGKIGYTLDNDRFNNEEIPNVKSVKYDSIGMVDII